MGYMERFRQAERAKPVLIETTKGLLDERLLIKREGDGAVEYYLDGELVHRSATVQLEGVQASGAVNNF